MANEHNSKRENADSGSEEDTSSSVGDFEIILKNRYQIYADQPLPDFAHQYADAYLASGNGKENRQYVAVVIKGNYPVRQTVLYPYTNLHLPLLMELVDWGVVEWSGDGITRYVLVYSMPVGNMLFPRNQRRIEALTEENIKNHIIPSVTEVLRNFSDRGFVHGNIRGDNILYSAKNNTMILGDCLTSFVGSLQPVLFETIERGMCPPHARGAGSIQDDIYSLGVTVALLLRGENQFLSMSDKDIIQMKANKGSFAMLTDGLRFTSSMSEFLRATLYDDTEQRWGIEQLISWGQGSRSPIRQKAHAKKAQRAVEFNGKKYYRVSLLAYDLYDNPQEAVRIIEDGTIIHWLERSLKLQETADALSEAISRASMGGKNGPEYPARLLTYSSMAMDPTAPIRYKDIVALPTGIANSLMEAILTGKDIKDYAELIKNRYSWTWLGFKENMSDNTLDLLRIYDLCSKIVVRGGISNGLERCLYELSPDAPCLSPLFQNKYIAEPKDMVEAMEFVAPQMEKSTSLIDRHVASFISCRDNKDQTGLIGLIQGTDIMRRSLAMITLFQNLQVRYCKVPLVNIAKKLAMDADTVIERYHNKGLANDIRQKIARVAEKGDITKLLSLVDNPQVVNQDKLEFDRARQEYASLRQEQSYIMKRVEGNKKYGGKMGRELAAIISCVLAGGLITTLLIITLTNGMGGH